MLSKLTRSTCILLHKKNLLSKGPSVLLSKVGILRMHQKYNNNFLLVNEKRNHSPFFPSNHLELLPIFSCLVFFYSTNIKGTCLVSIQMCLSIKYPWFEWMDPVESSTTRHCTQTMTTTASTKWQTKPETVFQSTTIIVVLLFYFENVLCIISFLTCDERRWKLWTCKKNVGTS